MANSIFYLGHDIFKMGDAYITTFDAETHISLNAAKVYLDYKINKN